ncbi:hypothetical protein MACK_002038 [Theileria orientalis]|uniref:Uncharacterized protein n=1 Tax=Theileria orientalis TaxID=68886 RepID=A0A976QWY3_THEOR|nr:hypothetical protein MACK_002038 [Theileria orientalis]
MIYFNIIQLFFILKLCSGMRYIDLKNNFISEGVDVQHGYFMSSGKYKMFHSRDPPLEIVQYGETRVFPDMDYTPGTHSLFVEQFKVGDEEALSIYVFRISVTTSSVVYKVYFHMSEFGYKLIDCAKFTELIKGKIHVSLDLSKSKNHPFFSIHTKEENGVSTTLIEIRKSIAGFRLRNVEAKRYEFGRIVDSTVPIYMGYSKLNMFLTKATSIYMHKEDDRQYIVLRHWTKNIRFDLTTINGMPAWNAVTDPEPTLSEDMHQKVFKMRDRIDGYRNLDVLSTLDLAEHISPELLGVEKVTGRHGGASYILYHFEIGKQSHNKIKFIINSEMVDMLIAKIDERTLHTKVEVIINSHRTFVIVTCLMKIDLMYETVINYYDKPNMENTNYYHIPEPYQTKIVSEMYKKYPIQIHMDIDSPPSLVDHGELQYDNYMLKYFRIKQEDGRGTVLTGKYVFGDIWQKDLIEIGNIPYEGNKRRLKVIAHSVNSPRIIVKPKNMEYPLLPEELQDYIIIDC